MRQIFYWIFSWFITRRIWFNRLSEIQNLYYSRGYDQGRFSQEAQTLWQKELVNKYRQDIEKIETKVSFANELVKNLQERKHLDTLSKKTERLIKQYEEAK